MEIDSKSFLESFLENNLKLGNAEKIYDSLWLLETGEELLFKNCCKILGVDRDEFLKNFDGTEIFDVDEDRGLTEIALAEKFGAIEYDNPNEPSYGTIVNIEFDENSSEYLSLRQKIYHSAVRDMVRNFDESDYSPKHILDIIENIGGFKRDEAQEKRQARIDERNTISENNNALTCPIGIEISNASNNSIGSFVTYLPIPSETIRYYLYDINISDWKDIVFKNITSDVPSLGDALKDVIRRENISPHRINEINFLAAKIEELDANGLETFTAAIEARRDCGNLTDIINLAISNNAPEGFVYQEPQDIPVEYIVYSSSLPQLIKIENTELSTLLMKMHAIGGDYMKDAAPNISTLLKDTSSDFLLLADGKEMHLAKTLLVYSKDTPEHDKWKNAVQTPETRIFAVIPTEHDKDDVRGSIIELRACLIS